MDPNNTSMSASFCQKVSKEEFEEDTRSETDKALGELCLYLEQNPQAYAKVLKKRKQEEIESAGVLSFVKSKVRSVLEGDKYTESLVRREECEKQTVALAAGMCKVFQQSQETKGVVNKYTAKIAEKRRAKLSTSHSSMSPFSPSSSSSLFSKYNQHLSDPSTSLRSNHNSVVGVTDKGDSFCEDKGREKKGDSFFQEKRRKEEGDSLCGEKERPTRKASSNVGKCSSSFSVMDNVGNDKAESGNVTEASTECLNNFSQIETSEFDKSGSGCDKSNTSKSRDASIMYNVDLCDISQAESKVSEKLNMSENEFVNQNVSKRRRAKLQEDTQQVFEAIMDKKKRRLDSEACGAHTTTEDWHTAVRQSAMPAPRQSRADSSAMPAPSLMRVEPHTPQPAAASSESAILSPSLTNSSSPTFYTPNTSFACSPFLEPVEEISSIKTIGQSDMSLTTRQILKDVRPLSSTSFASPSLHLTIEESSPKTIGQGQIDTSLSTTKEPKDVLPLSSKSDNVIEDPAILAISASKVVDLPSLKTRVSTNTSKRRSSLRNLPRENK